MSPTRLCSIRPTPSDFAQWVEPGDSLPSCSTSSSATIPAIGPGEGGERPIHDAVAVACVIWPDLVSTVDCYVTVETQSELCRGRTVVDRWHVTGQAVQRRGRVGASRRPICRTSDRAHLPAWLIRRFALLFRHSDVIHHSQMPLVWRQLSGPRRVRVGPRCTAGAVIASEPSKRGIWPSSHGLGADDVLMSRTNLVELRDALYQLEAAMEDVDTDLTEADDPGRHRSALWHLYGAAANLRGVRLEPKAVGPAD